MTMLNLLKKKISVYVLLVAIFFSAAISIIAFKWYENTQQPDKAAIGVQENNQYCSFSTQRLNGYNFIKPLLFADQSCESEKLTMVKNDISSYIDQNKQSGKLSAASIYFKELGTTEWTGYQSEEKHNPGSLLKVPELIALLKIEESHPGFLQKKIKYTGDSKNAKKQTRFLSKAIESGKEYSISELMKYMISYSDNEATLLLNGQIDTATFSRVFTDLGLKAPNWSAKDYPISAKDYSLFIRSLYNASYLTIPHSEMATELLSTCDFKDGFNKGLPQNAKLAHKYGMARFGNDHELSESGIIYLNDKAYLLTVMLRGKNFEALPEVLQQTCKLVYQRISA